MMSGATTAAATRKIIHLDMDCFYAAVEMREQPHLRGRPIGVGGSRNNERRGVLTTCNYEARAFGVRSAMPVFQALEKCSHLILVPARFDLYRAESARIREIFLAYTPLVEPLSLDEAYLDVTHLGRPASEVSTEIRQKVFEATGLTVSAGVAENKMLAKIASDLRKPNGQSVIKPAAVAAFMRDLPVGRIPGVGSVTAARFARLNIETCGQLQGLQRTELDRLFGKFGTELYERCRGLDDRPVVADRLRKSLSNERTFDHPLDSLDACENRLQALFAELIEDLEIQAKKDGEARGIHKLFVKVKFTDFTHTTIECLEREPDLSDYRRLLAEGWQRGRGRAVRLLGAGVRFALVPAALDLPGCAQLEMSFEHAAQAQA